jgi:hypothetical protein
LARELAELAGELPDVERRQLLAALTEHAELEEINVPHRTRL